MSFVNNIVASIASSLGLDAGTQAASAGHANAGGGSADNGFRALLAIGSEDATPADDTGHERDAASRDEKERGRDHAYPAAATVTVPSPMVDVPVKSDADTKLAGDSKPDVTGDRRAQSAASAPAGDKKAEKAGSPAAPVAQPASSSASAAEAAHDDEVPSPQEDIREALSAQFGNIAAILESLIGLLSGGSVASTQAADGAALTDGTGSDVSALQISQLKDILATVRDLKAQLLHAVAENPAGIVIVQQQVSVAVTQLQAGQAQITLPDELTALVDTLSSQLGQLLPALPEGEAADMSLVAGGIDSKRMAWLKMELRQSITVVRTQLQQISVANEMVYADAVSRFGQQLGMAGVDEQGVGQFASQPSNANGSDLLRQMLAMIGQSAVSETGDATPSVQQLAASAQSSMVDKTATVLNSQISFQTAVTTSLTADSGAGGNAGGQQGGGQSAPQTVPGVPAIGGAQSSGGISADATFARALALTAGASARPLAEQVAVQIKTAASDGSSRISIQLDPEDLGKLDIRLHVKADGKTGIVITADNGNTLNMLQKDAQNLLRALNDAGLQADSGSLNFNLRGDQQQGRQDNQHLAGNYQNAQPEEDEGVLLQAVTRHYVLNLNDGLDITI